MELKNRELKEIDSIEEVKEVKVDLKMTNPSHKQGVTSVKEQKFNPETNWLETKERYKKKREKVEIKNKEIPDAELDKIDVIDFVHWYEFAEQRLSTLKEKIDNKLNQLQYNHLELEQHQHQKIIEDFQQMRKQIDVAYSILVYVGFKADVLEGNVYLKNKDILTETDIIDCAECFEGMKIISMMLDKLERTIFKPEYEEILSEITESSLIGDISDAVGAMLECIVSIVGFKMIYADINEEDSLNKNLYAKNLFIRSLAIRNIQ